MTLTDLAPHLDQVRWRGENRLTASCPSHNDRHPSFGARQAEDRVLIHCWSGCTPVAICAALGIELADLFLERRQKGRGLSKAKHGSSLPPPPTCNDLTHPLATHAALLSLRGRAVLAAATSLDISAWADADLDTALEAVRKAHQDQERAALLDDVVFRFRLPRVLVKLGWDKQHGKERLGRFWLEGETIQMEVIVR